MALGGFKRRRTNTRRPVNKRKRITRPMATVSRPMNRDIHSFKRMATGGSPITGSVAYIPFLSGAAFSLSSLVNVSDFSNLFDQYRITYIVVKYWLKIDPSAQAAASASYPRFFWYRDYDDSTSPSSLDEMRENGKCKCVVMYPNRPVTIAFKPNLLNTLFNSGITSTYQPVWNTWVDMTNTGTTYYGYKYGIDDLTNTNYRVTSETTMYFQCRQSR